ncbi:LAETG motif-containing sortase-dependent surface protein [Streptomyces sp. R41]|uniref:LAETG motif-containing sortase-dependent surface protein n=1 Tax=Streptomyces sp. R41 TaxID=3238632 RepID=A0AB39RTK0_9ACTN
MAAASAAAVGVGLTATPASAHTPAWSVTCSQVTVDLTNYTVQVINTVEVTDDGKDLAPLFTFRDELHHTYAIPRHDKPVSIHIVVTAGDGGDTFEDTKTSPVCDTATPSATATSTTPSSTTPASIAPATATSTGTSSSASSAPSSNSPSAAGATPTDSAAPLAETGSSSATPLIAATAGVVVAAGAALLLVARRRRATRP